MPQSRLSGMNEWTFLSLFFVGYTLELLEPLCCVHLLAVLHVSAPSFVPRVCVWLFVGRVCFSWSTSS
jgi:hypothetical protein